MLQNWLKYFSLLFKNQWMLGNIHPPALCIDHMHFLFSLAGYGLQTLLKSALKEGTESYYSNHNGRCTLDFPFFSLWHINCDICNVCEDTKEREQQISHQNVLKLRLSDQQKYSLCSLKFYQTCVTFLHTSITITFCSGFFHLCDIDFYDFFVIHNWTWIIFPDHTSCCFLYAHRGSPGLIDVLGWIFLQNWNVFPF